MQLPLLAEEMMRLGKELQVAGLRLRVRVKMMRLGKELQAVGLRVRVRVRVRGRAGLGLGLGLGLGAGQGQGQGQGQGLQVRRAARAQLGSALSRSPRLNRSRARLGGHPPRLGQ